VKSYDEVIFTIFGEYKCGLFTHIKQKGATTNTTACCSAMDCFKEWPFNVTVQLVYLKKPQLHVLIYHINTHQAV